MSDYYPDECKPRLAEALGKIIDNDTHRASVAALNKIFKPIKPETKMNTDPTIRLKKLEQLTELATIPYNDGEQWIDVLLNIKTEESGEIRWGFGWKSELGQDIFNSFDEAIKIVSNLRKRAKL
jgi:hypothetical protein